MTLKEYIKWYLEEGKLKDEIPAYMQDLIKKNYKNAEKYLDRDVPEHTDKIPTVKIEVSDSGLKSGIIGELENGFANDIVNQMVGSELFKSFGRNSKFYNTLCASLEVDGIRASVSDIEKYKLLYSKNFRLLSTKDNDIENPIFGNNRSSIVKFIENYNRTFPDDSVRLDIEKDKKFLGLREPIVNYEKNIDSIQNAKLYLFITDKPDEKLRMSISKFFDSCQNMYTGSHKSKLLANVFDPNSKVAYLIFDVPFTDNMGNKVSHTPVARTMIRKSGDKVMFDRVYSKISGMDSLMHQIITDKTGLMNQGKKGDEYEYKGIGLPAPYMDTYKLKFSGDSEYGDDDRTRAMMEFANEQGAKIINVENNTFKLNNGESYEIYLDTEADEITDQFFRDNWLDYVYERETKDCLDFLNLESILDDLEPNGNIEFDGEYVKWIDEEGEEYETELGEYLDIIGANDISDLEKLLYRNNMNIQDYFNLNDFIVHNFFSREDARQSALSSYNGIEHEIGDYYIYRYD